MHGWSRWGIRRKLFAVMFAVLALHMVVLLFAGSYLFEWFYTNSKIAELKKSAQTIKERYQENQTDFFEQLVSIENQNMLISLVTIDAQGEIELLYHSRTSKENRPPRDFFTVNEAGETVKLPRMEVEQEEMQGASSSASAGSSEPKQETPREELRAHEWAQNEVFLEILRERLAGVGEEFRIDAQGLQLFGKGERDWKGEPMQDILSLSAQLGDETYLFLQTPRGYIASTAQLAVRYTAVLSSVILLMGTLAIFLLTERMTKPLRQLQAAAKQIARLDFSARCGTKGEDEIAQLGRSINEMSGELEDAIGKLVKANEVLQSDLERQQQTDRVRRQFTANVSHDFKTPLTLMMSYAEALKDAQTPETAREYCDIIMGEGERLSTMVGRLLELSRLENGAETMECSIFCLGEVLDEVIRGQRILSDKKQLDVSCLAGHEWIVSADYQKILRVMSNLLENAVKYTDSGGRITVDGQESGDICRIWVENTGAQIDPQQMDQLFDSFYRADASRTSGQSYGLGLAVVKGIMQAHGRQYGVENTPEGVRFWIELELADLGDSEDE